MRIPALVMSFCAVLAAGCASAPPTQFYVLTPESRAASAATKSTSITVGPVTVPDAIDRPQMVVSAGGNEVAVDEYHRWASPLPAEIARVVAANLGRELGAANVSSYGQSITPSADVQVLLDVRRFDSRLGEGVSVDVLWAVRKKGGTTQTGATSVNEPAGGTGFGDLAAAHSRALAKVSRDIATAIGTP